MLFTVSLVLSILYLILTFLLLRWKNSRESQCFDFSIINFFDNHYRRNWNLRNLTVFHPGNVFKIRIHSMQG